MPDLSVLYRSNCIICFFPVKMCGQSVLGGDDLFSQDGLEEQSSDTSRPSPGTIHHPQSSQLRDNGVFLVVSDSSSYEYTCPTHSAAELKAMSRQMSRMEGMGSGNITFEAADAFKRIEKHVNLHRENVQNLTSKL